MAKQTDMYNTVFDNIIQDSDLILLARKFNDTTICNYFYKYHKYEYLYELNGKIGSWFVLNTYNIWNRTFNEVPDGLKTKIIKFITYKIEILLKILYGKRNTHKTGQLEMKSEDLLQLNTDIDNLKKNIIFIGNVSRIKGPIELLKEIYSDKKITDVLILQEHTRDKLCFLNGYVNLNDMSFNTIKPNDYIMITTGYKYNTNPTKIKYVNDIIDNIASDTHKTYILYIISKCLFGLNKQRDFFIFTGSGCNGKSLLCDDLIKPTFGEYYKSIKAEYFTTVAKAGQATPELCEKEYCRILIASEPEANEQLQTAKIKKLTGLEQVQTRALFKSEREWNPQLTPFLLCNDIPNFSKIDNAITQRVKIIPFTHKFVDKPILDFERIINNNLKMELHNDTDDSIKQSFITILLEHYIMTLTITNDIISNNATTRFLESQNQLYEFINDNIKHTQGHNITYKDMYTRYIDYYNSCNNDSKKMLSSISFSKCMKFNNYYCDILNTHDKLYYYLNCEFIII